MKLIQFADYFNEFTGNPMQVYANLMKQKKFDVHVFSSDKIPTPAGYDDCNSIVKIHRFKGKIFGAKCIFPGVIPFFLSEVKEEDIVHAHVLGFFSVFVAGYMKFFKKFKLVITTDYDVEGKQNFFKRLFNYFFFVIPAKKADVLLPFAEKEKIFLNQRFGFDKKKMVVLPIGIHYNKFIKHKNNFLRKKFGLENKFVLLSVCYLSRKKNIEMMLSALNEIKNKNIVLLHIGGHSDSEYKKELDKMVSGMNLEKRVLFLGGKNVDELSQLYSLGDIFINSGFNESYCIPIIEAMASGLPVLTTRVGVAEEAIKDEKNGFFIESKKELKEKILFLFNNPETRKKMAEENINFSKKFEWKKIINDLEKIYLAL